MSGAVGAGAGNAVSQGLSISLGIQEKWSWGSFFGSVVGGGLGGGIAAKIAKPSLHSEATAKAAAAAKGLTGDAWKNIVGQVVVQAGRGSAELVDKERHWRRTQWEYWQCDRPGRGVCGAWQEMVVERVHRGNGVGTATQGAGARAQWKNRVCFVAGTPLLTADGSQSIESLKVGDRILSRDEHDVDSEVGVQVVEEVFVRHGKVLWLTVNGQRIGTTGEHPFWVVNREKWVAASDLSIGDEFIGHDGKTTVLEGTEEGEWATVYNLRVSEWHTYFVGSKDWGFDVWVHNNDGYGTSAHQAEQLRRMLAGREYQQTLNPHDAEFVGRILDAQSQLHGQHEALTRSQLQEAVAMRNDLASGARSNMNESYYDVIARLYAAEANSGRAAPAEFQAIRENTQSGRTAARILSQAQEYIPPGARNGNSLSSQREQLGYRLVKDGDGPVTWENGQVFPSVANSEIFHYGITSDFSGNVATNNVRQGRYSEEFLTANGLLFEPLTHRSNRQDIRSWEDAAIQSHEAQHGQRPQGNISPNEG